MRPNFLRLTDSGQTWQIFCSPLPIAPGSSTWYDIRVGSYYYVPSEIMPCMIDQLAMDHNSADFNNNALPTCYTLHLS